MVEHGVRRQMTDGSRASRFEVGGALRLRLEEEIHGKW